MRHYRIIRLVYIKEPLERIPGAWTAKQVNLLCEVLSEPKTWSEAYEMYRRFIWASKRARFRMPKDVAMEIVLHGYTTRHGRKTDPFSKDSLENDNIVKEREWLVMSGGSSE